MFVRSELGGGAFPKGKHARNELTNIVQRGAERLGTLVERKAAGTMLEVRKRRQSKSNLEPKTTRTTQIQQHNPRQ